MNEHIKLFYILDGDGGGKSIKKEKISSEVKSKRLTWINMDAKSYETRMWLEREVSYLDPFITEALLEDNTRPRMIRIGDGLLLILRGVNLNDNSNPEDMVSIRLWVDQHRIISVRKQKLKAVSDIENKIIEGTGPKDSGEFVCTLISSLFKHMKPVLFDLEEGLDHVEERVVECTDNFFQDSIIKIRTEAIKLKRYMSPQRDTIYQLYLSDLAWISDINKRQLQEEYNHMIRYVEDLDSVRERAQVVKDELSNSLANKLNRNMYFLSVISAIFLPLGFLTGLVGVNLGGIPGSDNSSAFVIFSLFLAALVLVQILIFKKLKWF